MIEKYKEIVTEVNEAFASGSTEDFLKHCAEDVAWHMIGEFTKKGRSEIREWMAEGDGMEPPKFTVEEIVGEENTVVCRGAMKMKSDDGSEGEYSYCDIYHFTEGKIDQLDSYIVKHTSNSGEQAAAG